MIIRDSSACPHTRVLDHSLLCELLHPDRVPGAEQLSCSVAHAIIPPGTSTLPHKLQKSTELYYILSGTGIMQINGESSPVHPGEVVLIPPGAAQNIRNNGDDNLVILCIVSPKWQAVDEVLVPVM